MPWAMGWVMDRKGSKPGRPSVEVPTVATFRQHPRSGRGMPEAPVFWCKSPGNAEFFALCGVWRCRQTAVWAGRFSCIQSLVMQTVGGSWGRGIVMGMMGIGNGFGRISWASSSAL